MTEKAMEFLVHKNKTNKKTWYAAYDYTCHSNNAEIAGNSNCFHVIEYKALQSKDAELEDLKNKLKFERGNTDTALESVWDLQSCLREVVQDFERLIKSCEHFKVNPDHEISKVLNSINSLEKAKPFLAEASHD